MSISALTESIVEPSLTEIILTSYEGKHDADGLYNGHGSAHTDSGCQYDGDFRNGLFHGNGKFAWKNRVIFEGVFESGKMMGKGKYTWPDGSTYEGDIVDGMRHGKGVFKCSAGQTYDGEWYHGKRNGDGKFFYDEDNLIHYTGTWQMGERHGYGRLQYRSGNSYEGEWFADKKSGRGVMIWKTVSEVYVGDWLEDFPHGFGEHIWGDTGSKSLFKQHCNIYRGFFYKGLRQGLGSFFYANGSQYSGEWVENYKEGKGVFLYPDGRIYVGDFRNDRIVSEMEAKRSRAAEDVSKQTKLYIDDALSKYSLGSLTNQAPGTEQSIPTKLFGTEKIIDSSTQTMSPTSLGKSGTRTMIMTNAKLNSSQTFSFLSTKTSTTEVVSLANNDSASINSQEAEMERLLLRYNAVMRTYFKKHADHASKSRQKNGHVVDKTLDCYVESWNKVEKVLFEARDLHKRLFSMSLDQMRYMLRALGLIGAHFNSYDMIKCYRQQKQHRRSVVERQCQEVYGDGALAEQLELMDLMDPSQFGSMHVYRPASVESEIQESRMPELHTALNLPEVPETTVPITSLPTSADAPRAASQPGPPASATQRNSAKAPSAPPTADKHVAPPTAPTAPGTASSPATMPETGVPENEEGVPQSAEPASLSCPFSFDYDPRQPLLESEFNELLVRCILDATAKRNKDAPPETFGTKTATDESSAFRSVFRVMAEKFEPMSRHKLSYPPFYVSFYHESVQTVIQGEMGSVLKTLFFKLVGKAQNAGVVEAFEDPVTQVCFLVKFFLSLKGNAIAPAATSLHILLAMGAAEDSLTTTSVLPDSPKSTRAKSPPKSAGGLGVGRVRASRAAARTSDSSASSSGARNKPKSATISVPKNRSSGIDMEGLGVSPEAAVEALNESDSVGTGSLAGDGESVGSVVEDSVSDEMNMALDASACTSMDYSWLARVIDYDDFLDLFCRVVHSKYWIYKKPEPETAAVGDAEVAPEIAPEPNNAAISSAGILGHAVTDTPSGAGESIKEKVASSSVARQSDVGLGMNADDKSQDEAFTTVLEEKLFKWLAVAMDDGLQEF